MAKARIASILADTLASLGVKRIYSVPGDSLNGITDARAHESIAWIHTRHEKAAAFGQEPKRTDRNLAVCAGSCGLENTHGRQVASGEFIPSMPKIFEAFSELEV
jgi:pyruvate dehydrogenase (quinone)